MTPVCGGTTYLETQRTGAPPGARGRPSSGGGATSRFGAARGIDTEVCSRMMRRNDRLTRYRAVTSMPWPRRDPRRAGGCSPRARSAGAGEHGARERRRWRRPRFRSDTGDAFTAVASANGGRGRWSDLTAMPCAVQLQNATVRFTRGDTTITAFEDVCLEVESGQLVTIIGPSGCGKSTLLRVVADLLPCTSGSVEVLGEPPARARIEREVGFVFQDATLLPWRTALQNVLLPVEVGGWRDKGALGRSAADLFRLIGLEGREGAFPHELSGGQRQRVSIARALISRPSILLMDEPFGALDEITRDRLNEELLRIWRETRTTILFVTHSLVEASYLGQRVAVMATNPGRIVQVVDLLSDKPDNAINRADPRFFQITTRLRRLLEATS